MFIVYHKMRGTREGRQTAGHVVEGAMRLLTPGPHQVFSPRASFPFVGRSASFANFVSQSA